MSFVIKEMFLPLLIPKKNRFSHYQFDENTDPFV